MAYSYTRGRFLANGRKSDKVRKKQAYNIGVSLYRAFRQTYRALLAGKKIVTTNFKNCNYKILYF